jgi:hypothetical protein
LLTNTWSLDGKHSIASIQPILYYIIKSFPGLYINYQGVTTINWNAEGSRVHLPIGAGIGRTWALGDRGYGLDFNFGIYFYPIRSDRTPLWSLKFGIGFIIP